MTRSSRKISRRGLLRKGAAVAAAGAALGVQSLPERLDGVPHAGTAFGQAPAIATARRFRAWVSRGTGRGRTTLEELRLKPITGRQVVIRTEACNLCYSNVGAVLGLQLPPPNTGGTNPA